MGVLGYEPVESRIGDECGAPASNGAPARRGVGRIQEVTPGSLAARAGFQPGDVILSVNGEPIRDVIDLVFHASETELDIRYQAAGEGPARRKRLVRNPGEELGIVLEDFKIRMCNNQCVFCFIHQNPPGLRKGIYFKDGDYRMSFLHGNYVTMTNFKDDDFERIVEQRLSPMYVSVHTTNPELRLRMLGVKRGIDVLDGLGRFARGRIEFHAQIVLCPGWNDGKELDRTISDLVKLCPHLLSIAIVPLGLTEHREGLPEMTPVTPSFCKQVIAQIEPWRARLKARFGEDILFLGDEFYVTANRPVPDYSGAEVLHQLENGVGMVWEFLRPWRSVSRRLPRALNGDLVLPPAGAPVPHSDKTKFENMKNLNVAQPPSAVRPRKVALLTGILGARILRRIAERLNRIDGLRVDVIPCMNRLFGRSITVSGLLSGGDFLRSIAENPGYDRYLIPGNAVRADGQVFLDDMPLEDLNRAAGGKVAALEGDCRDLVEAVIP